MSYINPDNNPVESFGIDQTITLLQTALDEISWLTRCFHRAYRHYEIQGKKVLTIPKTWEANNEWYNNLPNDNLHATAFFYPTGDEKIVEFNPHVPPYFTQDVALIVWVNTDKVAVVKRGPSLSQEKADVLAILNDHDLVTNIDSIVDKSADDIFKPFTIDDPTNHFTMLPFAGFRVNFTVQFDYIQCQSVSS